LKRIREIQSEQERLKTLEGGTIHTGKKLGQGNWSWLEIGEKGERAKNYAYAGKREGEMCGNRGRGKFGLSETHWLMGKWVHGLPPVRQEERSRAPDTKGKQGHEGEKKTGIQTVLKETLKKGTLLSKKTWKNYYDKKECI